MQHKVSQAAFYQKGAQKLDWHFFLFFKLDWFLSILLMEKQGNCFDHSNNGKLVDVTEADLLFSSVPVIGTPVWPGLGEQIGRIFAFWAILYIG
jgi:hypothetical protein